MEFINQEPWDFEEEKEVTPPPRKLLEYKPDAFVDDEQELWEAHEARVYRYEASAALDASVMRSKKDFDKAFKNFLERKRTLRAMRDGTYEPPPYEVDKGKVALTIAMQTASLTLAVFLSAIGAWPVALLTIPGFLAGNYYALVKESRE